MTVWLRFCKYRLLWLWMVVAVLCLKGGLILILLRVERLVVQRLARKDTFMQLSHKKLLVFHGRQDASHKCFSEALWVMHLQ